MMGDEQFTSKEMDLVCNATKEVFGILRESGEIRDETYGDDCGTYGYIMDTNAPAGFSYARVAFEGVKLLRILRRNGLLEDTESAQIFLFVFIGHQRGIF